jgi:hypothetical protein
MHTGHILAIKAETPEQAISIAQSYSEDIHWTDWFEIGGRWQDTLGAANVLGYNENPQKFREVVEEWKNNRFSEIARVIQDYGSVTVKELLTDPKYSLWRSAELDPDTKPDIKDALALWNVKRACDAVEGSHIPEVTYYDIEYGTADPQHLWDRTTTDPDNQYIVIVDYHY